MDLSERLAGLTPEQREALLKKLQQQKKQQQAATAQAPQLIPKRTASDSLPLSFAQERLWFLDQLEPGNISYNRPPAVRLKGEMNVDLLEKSLQEIVNRHEILRTTYVSEDGKAMQVIAPSLKVPFRMVDLTHLPEADREGEARRLCVEDVQAPYDLARGPMFRVTLFRFSETDHVLMLGSHHIATDGWSDNIMVRELAVIYEAFHAGKPHPLPELPVQYADYALWQRNYLQGDVLEEKMDYWRKKLAGELPVLELPTDRARPAVQTYNGTRHYHKMPQALSEQIKTISRQEGVTLFMTLLAAFQTLLHRYSGQDDILVGSTNANRTRSELEGMIGFFANTVVLRTYLDGNPSFRELLGRVKETALGAFKNQDIPFEKLVHEFAPKRDLSHTPLFQVMFALQNAPAPAVERPGLQPSPFRIDSEAVQFDLTLSVTDFPDGMVGMFEYNTDLFDKATVERIGHHFETLLASIAAAPEQPIGALSMLPENEREQVLRAWNATDEAYPSDACLHQLIEAQVERTPDRIALVVGDRELTYRELNDKSNQLASYLREKGVGPDKLVGICVDRSVEMVIGLLAILKAGGAYVPLDPAYPQDRILYVLEDADALLMLSEQSVMEQLPDIKTPVVLLDTIWEEIASLQTENLPNTATSRNLAYVIYTSGSTGNPKGVMLEHQSVVNFMLTMQKAPGLAPSDRLLAVTTLSFDIAGLELYLPLITGAVVDVASRDVATDARLLMARLAQTGTTVMQATPATWRMLLASDWAGSPELKVLCGGEALPRELANALLEKVGDVWNVYGPTETTIWSTVEKVAHEHGPVLIGNPIANTQCYILDANLQPVPVGVAGELLIAGDGLARGYFKRPDLTEEKFLPDPFSSKPGARMYKTGDLARYRPDGKIECLGRLDHQVKIRGFRIELGEIESVLADHPVIRQGVVVAQKDGGNARLVAYFTVKAGEERPSISDLRTHLSGKLPGYMVPSLFVAMEELPLTPNGKIDRRALPKPEEGQMEVGNQFVAPRTPIEEKLAAIWAELLGHQQVGVEDSFFELGGHSLLATQLLAKVCTAFQVELPLRTLFETPTIAGMAAAIYAGGEAEEIDFVKEVKLDPQIGLGELTYVPVEKPKNLLLTGATGYLGSFLLQELLASTDADIHCLVRAKSAEDGLKRIRSTMESYKLWDDEYASRILPVLGDLERPLLGLDEAKFNEFAELIDGIYHNGAFVNFVYPYQVMKAANVLGTEEVLRLASRTRIKPVYHVSTIYVHETRSGLITEADDIGYRVDDKNGYTQSKWVAERVAMLGRERGLPVSIYRPGRIFGHSETGVCQPNDFLWRMVRACLAAGSMPDVTMTLDFTPIDYVCKSIVYLSQQAESIGKDFHLFHKEPITLCDLRDFMISFGYNLKRVSYPEWQEALFTTAQNAAEPLLALFTDNAVAERAMEGTGGGEFDTRQAVNGLAGTTIVPHPINDKLLRTYFSYFIEIGFLDAPEVQTV